MSSAVARVVRFCVAGLALGATNRVSIAQNQPEPAVEKAPLGRVITVNDAAGAAQRVFRGEYLYESKGYVIHQPVNYDREFFEVTPGQRGQAVFVSGTVTTTVDLEFKLDDAEPDSTRCLLLDLQASEWPAAVGFPGRLNFNLWVWHFC